jgi:alginate O-acetyltransferase complex protein AlgJ
VKFPNAWANVPVWCSAVSMFLAGILLILNLFTGAFNHGRYMKLCAAVYGGAVPADDLRLTPRSFADGSYQALFARRIGFFMPYQPAAVRLRNQLAFSVFHTSTTPLVLVGRQDVLYEPQYVREYCARNVAAFTQTAPAWAADLRRMQDIAAAHKQSFIYVITPSKAAQYPDTLPATPPCRASATDRMGKLPTWLHMLKNTGVRSLDTTEIVTTAKPNYPFWLIPRGGAHWTSLASALAAQALESKIATLRPNAGVVPLGFTWHISHNPVGVDMDDASIMNLIWPLNHYDVPVLTFDHPLQAAQCHPLRIVIVGGSFVWGMASAMSHLPCAPRIVEYWYWSLRRYSWVNGAQSDVPIQPAQRDAELRQADILIYEENESVLAQSTQGPPFYHWLLADRPIAPGS